jgi:DHA2 family multidrug resistance protein-like MFS transporter
VRAAERGAEAPPAPARSARRSGAQTGAFAALALVALDVAAVPAALPSARIELGTSASGLLWIQDAYLLALAVALVLLGQAGAALDRRVPVVAGGAAFAAGAVLASAADATSVLVAGRALQGAGAAGLLVPALEFLRQAAGDRARGAPAALLALAVAAPAIGGALTEAADWRWLFRVELAAVAVTVLLLTAGGRGAQIDRPLPGRDAVALGLGLALAVTGLIQSGPWGLGSADTLLLLAAGAALLAFAWREGLAGAGAVAAAGCLGAALLLAPQYLELVRGLSPLRSGLLTLALTLPAAGLVAFRDPLAGRMPPGRLAASGLACAALGALGMTRLDPASSYALVVLSLVLLGAGIGAAARQLAPRAETAGVVAAGAALVVAAAGALLQQAQLDEREAGGSFEAALAAGVAAAGWLLAALLAAAALLAFRQAGR